ncbi:MAG: mechanosensitive ion channel family protein [Haloarculaceae archaeon]
MPQTATPEGASILAVTPPSAPVSVPAVPLQGLVQPSWFPEWVPEWVLPFIASVLVVVLSWVLARLVVRLFGRRIARRFERPSLTRTALRGLRLTVYLLGFFTVLRINGFDLGSIALSVTVFSAVVGVILAPIVGSFISGVFLLADQPYEIGDMIELDDGTRGFVDDITLRYTKMFTLDNTFLVIPNGTIRDRDVTNYSAEDTRTRLALDVLVTYESDIPAARELIERAARNVDVVIEGGPRIRVGAARYPAAPTCYIEAYADNGVNLRLRYWAKEPYKLLTIRSRVQEEVWAALEETDADIEVAYPHSHLVFDETSGQLNVATGGSAGSEPAVDGDRGPAAREPPVPEEPSEES